MDGSSVSHLSADGPSEGRVAGDPPRLQVLVQPNKNQKRRYNSDGPTRGQIKDDSGEKVPTVRLENFPHHVLMYMMACTSNGEPHPFFELQSVDKCGCKQSTLDGRPAVVTETSPEKAMEARFAACLKRLAMRTVQETNEHDFTKWKCESEKVHLGFLAVALPRHQPLASCLSNPIHMVQGRLLEMKRIIPSTGTSAGENVVCITGKNFPASANLKVRFFLNEGPDRPMWESYGDVDNGDSSEKHLVITVPRGPGMCAHRETVQVAVEILPATTTQTRQKTKHLYYSYMSSSASQGSIASRIKMMQSSIAEVRQDAQTMMRRIEPNTQGHISELLPEQMMPGFPPFRGPSVGHGYPVAGAPGIHDGGLHPAPLLMDPRTAPTANAAAVHPPAASYTSELQHPSIFPMSAGTSMTDESMETTSVTSPRMFSGAHFHPGIKTEQFTGTKRPNMSDGPEPSAKMANLSSHMSNGGTLPRTTTLTNNSSTNNTLDHLAASVFSPEAFSTVAQPSPVQSQASRGPSALDIYSSAQQDTGLCGLPGAESDLRFANDMGRIPNDFLFNIDHYSEEDFSQIVNAADNSQLKALQQPGQMPHQQQQHQLQQQHHQQQQHQQQQPQPLSAQLSSQSGL
ncbi:nuclear factor of activated T-cells 5-like [Sycon ciliatum]|uniref:nuclear factor of activated T-cells 5-like n=1 Tax=Sycon ciliatum TaxID=27933 RepID=UPI0031F60242